MNELLQRAYDMDDANLTSEQVQIFEDLRSRVEELEGVKASGERREGEDLNDWLTRIGAYK